MRACVRPVDARTHVACAPHRTRRCSPRTPISVGMNVMSKLSRMPLRHLRHCRMRVIGGGGRGGARRAGAVCVCRAHALGGVRGLGELPGAPHARHGWTHGRAVVLREARTSRLCLVARPFLWAAGRRRARGSWREKGTPGTDRRRARDARGPASSRCVARMARRLCPTGGRDTQNASARHGTAGSAERARHVLLAERMHAAAARASISPPPLVRAARPGSTSVVARIIVARTKSQSRTRALRLQREPCARHQLWPMEDDDGDDPPNPPMLVIKLTEAALALCSLSCEGCRCSADLPAALPTSSAAAAQA